MVRPLHAWRRTGEVSAKRSSSIMTVLNDTLDLPPVTAEMGLERQYFDTTPEDMILGDRWTFNFRVIYKKSIYRANCIDMTPKRRSC